MKAKERKIARELRSKGWSLRSIAVKVKCSKGTVSRWISDIDLTDEQVRHLKSNQDKGRAKAAQHPNSPKKKWEKIRNTIIEDAFHEMPNNFSNLDTKIVGAALYWAEGYNAARNHFFFANSSTTMIRLMMKFLRNVCHVPEGKIKGRVNIHPHLDINKAEKFWINITKISRANFKKPLIAVSKASKQKKDSLPFGTFNIIVYDVILASRIKGWIKALSKWADSSVGQNG